MFRTDSPFQIFDAMGGKLNSTNVLDGFAVLHAAAVDRLDHLDRDGVAELVSLSARLRGWHDSVDLRLAQRAGDLKREGRSEGPESMFSQQGNRSSKDSDTVTKRAEIAKALPNFGNGLANGEVSSGHLDAMANIRSGLDEQTRATFDEHNNDLLAAASHESVDIFARRCRDLARRLTPAKNDADELDQQKARSNIKRWVDKITGMHITRLEIDPVRDATVWNAVNTALATLKQLDGNAHTPWQQMQVNAFVAAVQGGVICDPDNPSPMHQPRRTEQRIPEITVLIDLQTLLNGLHDHTLCETEDGIPLPVSTVRRMCCDAEIIPAVLDTDSELVDLGRTARTVTRAQRRALRAMHRTCARPDCTVPFSACKIHHVRWWQRDRGPTNIDNLLPLCETDHHLVHEGRWTLTMSPNRIATWTRPDGTIHHTGPTTNRQPTARRTAGNPTTNNQITDNRPAHIPMTT